MGSQAKNVIIGIFVLTALAIVVFILLFLHPKVGDDGQVLHVRFSDIDKVTVGTRVTYAGRPVGEVTQIEEVKDGRSGPLSSRGQVYVYDLTIVLDSGIKVYNTDKFALRTSGLLGERSVAIIPQPFKEGVALKRLVRTDLIYAEQSGSVEDAMKDFKDVADHLDITLDVITQAVQEMNNQKLWQRLGATIQNIQDISDALNKPKELAGIIDNAYVFSENLVKSWGKVDVILDDVKIAAKDFQATTANTKDMTADGKFIVEKVKKGEGTIGKLFMTDDLYLRLTSLLSKGDTIFNDINHYGLLFHNNKEWQRLRARRLNLMQELSSAQQFRNYFNDEMDQVSTSLSRVSMVLDMGPYPPMEDRQYQKVYAELLRRVDAMQESLKMYNQQVVDAEVKKTEFTDRKRG